MLTAVIIDDEKTSRDTLAGLLRRYCPEVKIIGEADGCQSGIDFLYHHNPDVVFLDIQMPDGSGFRMLESIGQVDFEVIFVTAFDQYAIQAIRHSALDYLQKPIIPDELVEAVKKAVAVRRTPAPNKKIEVLLENIKDPVSHHRRIVLHTADKIVIAHTDTIIRCESDDYYTWFYFTHAKPLLVSKTLKEFEEMLVPHGFVRVHKSHLVNLHFVKSLVRDENAMLIMEDQSMIPVSRRRKEYLMECLKQLSDQ